MPALVLRSRMQLAGMLGRARGAPELQGTCGGAGHKHAELPPCWDSGEGGGQLLLPHSPVLWLGEDSCPATGTEVAVLCSSTRVVLSFIALGVQEALYEHGWSTLQKLIQS